MFFQSVRARRSIATRADRPSNTGDGLKRLTAWIFLPAVVGLTLAMVPGSATAAPTADQQEAVATKKSNKVGQTKKTKKLNKKIKPSNSGVIVRSLPDDNIVNGLAVAAWTRNDLKAPTSMYVTQGPWCGAGTPDNMGFGPNGVYEDNSFYNSICNEPSRQGDDGVAPGADAYLYAQVGLVTDKQDFTVNTYYPTDANAIDKRCFFDPATGNYRCASDPNEVGPAVNLGRGCSESQVDAPGPDGVKLVSNSDCQCNTGLSGNNWQDWVDHWLAFADRNPFKDNYSYFSGDSIATPFNAPGGTEGKAPMFALDWSSCWFDNKDDMVGLQNALWFSRAKWWNGLVPRQPDGQQNTTDVDSMKYYWGWNEIPVKATIDQQKNWTSALIHLPAGTERIKDLSSAAKKTLKKDLKGLSKQTGFDIGSKKKGKISIMTEEYVGGDSWKRKFVCEKHKFGKNLRIDFKSKSKKSNGYCYVKK